MMDPDFELKVVGTYIGYSNEVSTVAVASLGLTPDGILRDRHLGHCKLAGVREKQFHPKGKLIFNARQWSAVEYDELADIAKAMDVPEIKPEWLGANLLLRGTSPGEHCDFTKLPGLTRLVIGDGDKAVVLLVYGENLPCTGPAEAMVEAEPKIFAGKAPLFGRAALGKRGLVGWVEAGGTVRPNDLVKIYLPK